MDMMNIIKTRKSIRTFSGEKITENDMEKLQDYIETITNPYNIPVKFLFLDKEEFDLSSPVIKGEDTYIAAKVPRIRDCEVAFGYSFEKMILYAWSLGIGSTWIGGTFNRELFEKAADTGEGEYMMITSPLGYPSKTQSDVDLKLRQSVRGDERLSSNNLFFDDNFNHPLNDEDEFLEAVRWAPSAANRQPWRVVKKDNKYHFYEHRTIGYNSGVDWDVQKIDLGIAICHFLSVCNGKFLINNPCIEVDENTEYIATIEVNIK